jgi:hypothetical protein
MSRLFVGQAVRAAAGPALLTLSRHAGMWAHHSLHSSLDRQPLQKLCPHGVTVTGSLNSPRHSWHESDDSVASSAATSFVTASRDSARQYKSPRHSWHESIESVASSAATSFATAREPRLSHECEPAHRGRTAAQP